MVLRTATVDPPQANRQQVFRIHVLGAESTGKSSLSDALSQRLRSHNNAVTCVTESLRHWVEIHGRTPIAEEQAALAQQQEQAIAQACLELALQPNPMRWVLADTSPLMTAAYSAHYFNDHSLWDKVMDFESTADLRLLMGLDLPWKPDVGQRDGPAHQKAVDVLLRHALQSRGLPFTVIYGQGEARTQAAWRAIQSTLQARNNTNREHQATRRNWRALCECCADPDCELALFSQRST